MSDIFSDLRTSLRFTLGLKKFLTDKMTLPKARQIIQQRMAQREENFLKVVKKGVFEYKKSPYLPLFKLSGCGYQDVERMVARSGLEAALRTLKEEGVYFTIEEFKGRSPVRRKGKEIIVKEGDFDNPYIAACYEKRSGGTRSAGTRTMVDFDHLTNGAIHKALTVAFWNLLPDMPHVILRPTLPYTSGANIVLQFKKTGIDFAKWISIIDERNLNISLRGHWGVSYVLWLGRRCGMKLPRLETIPFSEIGRLSELFSRLMGEAGGCCVHTNVSRAVRICLAAREKKIDLKGLTFRIGGEPLTAAKKQIIESTGAIPLLMYTISEMGGVVGDSCTRTKEADDVHLFKDFLALISYPRTIADFKVDSFLFSSLLPTSPKILLNVESGDHGIIQRRKCGCPYEELGYDEHILRIRSFEKLTGEGATFYGSDLTRLVEDVFPSRFGGTGLDYQFVEKTGANGITNLFILAAPAIGPLDEKELAGTLIKEFKKGPDCYRMMAQVWSEAGTVQVKRQIPMRTGAGKQYPLYIAKEGEAL